MKKILSTITIVVLILNVFTSCVFAASNTNITLNDIKKSMEEYYGTEEIAKEFFEEYDRLKDNKSIKPWDFKRERAKLLDKYEVKTNKKIVYPNLKKNVSMSGYYEGQVRIIIDDFTSYSGSWNNQDDYSTGTALLMNTFLVGVGLTGPAGAIFSAVGSIGSSFLESNPEYFTDIYIVSNHSYFYNEKNIEVYSKTPYGYEWTPYVLAEKRRTDAHVMTEWYYNGSPKNDSDVFECIRLEYARSYGDDEFYKQLALGKYLSGNHNVEVYRYYTGDSYDFPENIPGN